MTYNDWKPIAVVSWATQQELFYMRYPTNRMLHTTAFATPVVEHWLEREIDQWVHQVSNVA